MIIHDNYDEAFQFLGQEGFSYVPLQSSRCWRLWVCLNTGDTPCCPCS